MNVNDSFCQLTMIVSVTTSHSMIVCVSFAEEADGVEVVSIKVGGLPLVSIKVGEAFVRK